MEPKSPPSDGEKKRLRKEMLNRRDLLSVANRVIHSATILQKVFELEIVREARWVKFYASYGSEVETLGMIAHALSHGKKVAVPKVVHREELLLSEVVHPLKELEPGWRGIPEPKTDYLRPVDLNLLDLFVVPGVAFDSEGNRLGQGRGIYDRLLSSVKGRVPIIGLAFDLQIISNVPVYKGDVQVDWIVTQSKVFRCSSS